MKNYLNNLYITTENSYLSKTGECIKVKVNEEKYSIPFRNICSIVCFGKVLVSPYLMSACAEKGITIVYLDMFGRFLARVNGPISGNVLLRKSQYLLHDDRKNALVRGFVISKITNMENNLLRNTREAIREQAIKVVDTIDVIRHIKDRVEHSVSIDTIRGLEGDASKRYFSVYNSLIRAQKDIFVFIKRSKRPPKDMINALMSYIYSECKILTLHQKQASRVRSLITLPVYK